MGSGGVSVVPKSITHGRKYKIFTFFAPIRQLTQFGFSENDVLETKLNGVLRTRCVVNRDEV